jgi:poly-gamma-glutamate capsule biosynthesis protein CapA/YwtB (metallophosphatase superfamily)
MGGLRRRQRAAVMVAAVATAVTCGLATSVPAAAGTAGTDPPAHPSGKEDATPDAAAPVRLSAVGDMILGNTPDLPARPRHYLDVVDRAITGRANLVFANLEGTLTTRTEGKCRGSGGGDCFNFRNPPRYAGYFAAAGFTVVNNANNHSHDFGQSGLDDTVHAIRAAGMKQTGLPGQITVVRLGSVRVALVGFAPYAGTADMLRLRSAAALIREARTRARVVIVYMHAGAEGSDRQHVTGAEEYFVGEDRGNPQRFAHMAIRNGASLVITSGPHVVRGMEFFKGHLIAYSLGNFANFHNFGSGGVLSDSAILHVALTAKGGFKAARLRGVLLDSSGHPTMGGGTVALVKRLSKEDFHSHRAHITKAGRIHPPA